MSEYSRETVSGWRRLFRKLQSSYLEKRGSDVEWLSRVFSEELSESGSEIAGEMLETAERFRQRKGELVRAVQSGLSKEQWLADFLRERSIGMPVNEYGRLLLSLEEGLSTGNERFSAAGKNPRKEDISNEGRETVNISRSVEDERHEYNHYETEELARSVGKRASMLSLLIHSEDVGIRRADERWRDVTTEEEEVSGLDDYEREVIALGGFRIAVRRGEVPNIDKASSPSLLSLIVCAASERCRAAKEIVSGKLSMIKGADHLARVFPVMMAAALGSTLTLSSLENVQTLSETAPAWAMVSGGLAVLLALSEGVSVGGEVSETGQKLSSFAGQVAKAASTALGTSKRKNVGTRVRTETKRVET